MGKFSRDKGARAERAVRDVIRTYGYECNRVPLSGAAKGFKDDLVANSIKNPNEGEIRLEVKCRASGFDKIQKLLDHLIKTTSDDAPCINIDGTLVKFSNSFIGVTSGAGTYVKVPTADKDLKAGLRKLITVQKWLGGAMLLALKQDHMKPIFILYPLKHPGLLPNS